MNADSHHPASHIGVIESSGRLYGSEYCLLDIIDGLRSKFDWRVIMPAGHGFDELLTARNVECDFLMPPNPNQTSRLKKFFAYGRILARLCQMRPDVLYVNQTGSLRAAAVHARLLRLPIVCQVQTLEDAIWLSERPALHKHVYAFICNSEYIAQQTHVDATKKCVLYQGLPPHRYKNSLQHCAGPRKKKPGCFTVGILGRIAVSKGHYLLIEAAKTIVESIPDCQFVVIGEGLTPHDTSHYRAAVADAGLESRFEFRGYRTDVAAELRRLDVLAIPSLAEPLGRVLFDAAEFNLPVVLSDAGGLGEVSRRFEIGIAFASGDATSLANSLDHACRNFEKVAEDFHRAAVTVFARLPLPSYLQVVEEILTNTAHRQASQLNWLGD